MQEVDNGDLRDILKTTTIPVLIDFYADWCVPCRGLTTMLEVIEQQLDGQLKIVKLDVDNSDLAPRMGVRSIPTLILVNSGSEIKRWIGSQSRTRLMRELSEAMVET